MKKLIKIEPDNNYFLTCYFEDGTVKRINLSSLLNYPVFAPLKNESVFKTIKNKSYFVEWEGYDIDLSADTLWSFQG
jgi:hypothetical protein